jgi:hypothetical protein
MTNVYIGEKGEDIALKYGDDVNDFQWTILNADGSAYSFTNLTDVTMDVYNVDGYGRRRIFQRPNDTQEGIDNVSANIIEWNDLWSSINLAFGDYYYEINYQDSAKEHPNIFLVGGKITVE